jgi:predicted outer membrane repeat protein
MKKLLPARTPLSSAFAALLCTIPASQAAAAFHTVQNCDDDGSGSLRAVVDALTVANSGDTVNMTGLNCGTISLSTGGIAVPLDDLTFIGPGSGQLTIERKSGSGKQRIFHHTGSGTLSLSYVTISNGYYGGSAQDIVLGGCIKSQATVYLDHVRVTGCTVAAHNTAIGGGISAIELTLRHSILSGNTAKVQADATTGALGGGASADYVTVSDSTIANNSSEGTFLAHGGGMSTSYGSITTSTFHGNHADGRGGAIAVENICAGPICVARSLALTNSTISGNDAEIAGGIYLFHDTLDARNSTIAENSAVSGAGFFGPTFSYFGAGVFAYTSAVNFESTLIANNSYGSPAIDSDFSTFPVSFPVTGANNLIREGNGDAPAGSMHGACPRLGPLRDNGGITLTHALHSGSPAIDAGDNNDNHTYDQRLAPYLRENGTADIGAFERQAEQIFDTGFDGCVPLR